MALRLTPPSLSHIAALASSGAAATAFGPSAFRLSAAWRRNSTSRSVSALGFILTTATGFSPCATGFSENASFGVFVVFLPFLAGCFFAALASAAATGL